MIDGHLSSKAIDKLTQPKYFRYHDPFSYTPTGSDSSRVLEDSIWTKAEVDGIIESGVMGPFTYFIGITEDEYKHLLNMIDGE